MATPHELLCIFIPRFELQVLAGPGPAEPCALATRDDAQGRLLQVDPRLAPYGVASGQTVAQARAFTRFTVVLPHPERTRRCHEEVLEAIHAVASPIECRDPGQIYVKLGALKSLYPAPAALIERLERVMAEAGLTARFGVGSGRFAARMIALYGPERGGSLSDLPLTRLPIPVEVRDAMVVLGLKTIGDLSRLSGRQVADRYGPDGVLGWRLARGEDPLPFEPWSPGKQYHRSIEPECGYETVEQLLFALSGPLDELLSSLCGFGEPLETLSLIFHGETGSDQRLVVDLPVSEASDLTSHQLLGWLSLKLEGVEAGRVTKMSVHARLSPPGRAGSPGRRRSVDGPARTLFDRDVREREPLSLTVARLRTKLGPASVLFVAADPSLCPEDGWTE
ncbi:MAG: DNA polymerase Y family protein, partial [Candidatus Riflebacteria bacterium]|nr:DNA polymerase Y family protein [Candidatus Riflebacteria bacterium]